MTTRGFVLSMALLGLPAAGLATSPPLIKPTTKQGLVKPDPDRAVLQSRRVVVDIATLRGPANLKFSLPLFGHDVDESVMLPEIPFESLLSHTKGCYPGQEVVVRIRDRGHVNRMLRGLALEGDQVPPQGAEIAIDDALIGKVTSAAWSFGLARPIALGFVRRQHAEAGTRVAVRFAGTSVAATVSALPFAR